jgi:hypothetical protein
MDSTAFLPDARERMSGQRTRLARGDDEEALAALSSTGASAATVRGRDVGAAAAGSGWAALAVVSLALTYLAMVPELDSAGGLPWNQGSNYALVRALGDGTAKVDTYAWQTGDLSYVDGHFYSVRAPGLAFLTLPVYEVAAAAGVNRQGVPVPGTPSRDHGALGMIWVLGLVGGALTGIALVLVVRRVAERYSPGLGTATGITVGLATLVLPFSTMFFVHVLSALLGFSAFAVLVGEREEHPGAEFVLLAGVLAGLAVTSEYALAIVAVVLGVLAVSRRPVLRRGLAYCAGLALGVLPLVLYNRLAFGSVFHLSYADAVKGYASDGRPIVGLNDEGFYGVRAPSLSVARDLLFSDRGLIRLSPVLALSVIGLYLLYRTGRRAEALTIAAVAVGFLVYDSGYINPFGGESPGPRFLIPAIPFLGVTLGLVYRRFPALTIGFAVASAALMVVATGAETLVGAGAGAVWRQRISAADFQPTVITWLGAGHGWAGLSLFVVAAVAAACFAAAASRPALRGRLGMPGVAVIALLVWLLIFPWGLRWV